MADRSEDKVELAPLPEWIRILPLGKVELSDSREPFEVDADSLSSMAAGFRSRGVDLVIDYEHQSFQGERAPAAGWIKDLEARTDGLWAKVEWTRQAAGISAQQGIPLFFPGFAPGPCEPPAHGACCIWDSPTSRPSSAWRPWWPSGAGRPKRWAVAVNPEAQSPGEERGKSMEKIREWLGLGLDVKDEAVASRMLEFLGDLAASLNLPREASLSQLKGAVAALQAGAASLRERTEELVNLKAHLAAETAYRAVDGALQAGKVSPAQKEWALEYFRQDPEGFATYVARAPKMVPVGEALTLVGEDRSAAELGSRRNWPCAGL